MIEDFPRLGVLVPSSNVSTERDYHDLLPDEVSLHVARMYMADASTDAARALVNQHVWRAAEDLATARPHVAVFSCTGAGAMLGPAGERELIDRLTGVLGCPVVSTNDAVSRVLDRHKDKGTRLAVLTPYVDDITAHVVAGRQREGYEIVCAAGMGIEQNFDIARVGEDDLLAFAEQHLRGVDFDMLFVSCTNLRMANAVASLREVYDVPVVASNVASLEAALEMARDLWPNGVPVPPLVSA